jgi:hypothetical protein
LTKKLKFTVYANCQSDALANLLLRNPFFAKEFELTRILPVHLLKKSSIPDTRKVISDIDLCISQPVSAANGSRLSTKEVGEALGANGRMLTFPSIYFDGYFPHLIPLAGMQSVMNNAHDVNVMVLSKKGYSADEIYEIISDKGFYDSSLTQNLFTKSINELRERESANNVDILVSNYILSRHKESILFNTYNHPSNQVLMEVASQVCKMINIDNSIYSELEVPEILGAYRAKPYISTSRHLDLSESIDAFYQIEGQKVKHQDIVAQLVATYNKHLDDKVLSQVSKKAPSIIANLQKY